MKSLLKFGIVLLIFGVVMSLLTTVLIRANAVPKAAVKAAVNTSKDFRNIVLSGKQA